MNPKRRAEMCAADCPKTEARNAYGGLPRDRGPQSAQQNDWKFASGIWRHDERRFTR